MDAAGDGRRAYEDPVARWVAEGLRDAEIAVRLGVSVGEARTRRYRLTDPPSVRGETALPLAVPLAPSSPPTAEDRPRRAPPLVRFAPAAVVALVALGAGLWVTLAGEREAPAERTVSVSPLAVAHARQPDRIRPGPPIEFPDDLSLVIRAGGDREHGPRELQRLYRDPSGTLLQETLLVAPDGASIGQVVSDSDGWALVAAMHTPETTTFVRSDDGGVNWTDIGTLPGYREPVGLYGGEAVVWLDSGDGLGLFTRLPSGVGFLPPYPGGKPIALLARGKLLWHVPGSGQIAETDGAPYLAPDIDPTSYYAWLAPQPTGAGTMVQWDGLSPLTGETDSFVGIVNSAGAVTQEWSGIPGSVVGRVDGATLVVVMPATGPGDPRDSMAALVELNADRWRPIVTGFALVSSHDSGFVASVRRGPFVRVETRAECAPVRASSERTADVLVCLKNGVLLRSPGETRVHNDYTWLHVIGPSGRPGWVDVSHVR